MIELPNPYQLMLAGIPKIHTDLLWLLTIIFCGVGVLYFIFVFFFRNKISKRANLVAYRKKELAPMISHFLFYEPDVSQEESKLYLSQKVEIRELVKSKFNREVLSEILMDLQKDVSGDTRQKLCELYKNLGLHQDAFSKLNSWRWEVVSQGILELTQMRVEESYMFIRRFINHRKGVIRKQAQIATVSLKHEGIAYFLDTCRFQISEWQQLKLLDVLRHLENFNPPKFKVWLTSKNKDVVLFSLRLIRYYNQNDANQAIIQLIKHRDSQIKSEAIHCLKEFGAKEAISTLKTSFRKCDTEVKIAILDTISVLGSKSEIGFLKKVERSDNSFIVKSKALTAINTIDPDYIIPSENIVEPSAADLRYAEEPHPPAEIEPISSVEHVKYEEDDIPESADIEIAAQEIPNELIVEGKTEEPDIPEHVTMEEEFSRELSESEEENEILFDICCMEEFQDILEETNPTDEVEYLPLNFLPFIESDHSNAGELDTEYEKEANPVTERQSEDKSFKEDLENILNKIAMNEDKHKSGNQDELPEFLPKVVENQDDNINAESDVEERSHILDLEVKADVVTVNTEPMGAVPEADPVADIMQTPVVAETISWGQLIDEQNVITDHTCSSSADQEELTAEELLGFCIFQEMFRDFDSESKLILLDEILVVGEEKELIFLDTLFNDPDKRVRNKARKIRYKLAEKLDAQAEARSEEQQLQTKSRDEGEVLQEQNNVEHDELVEDVIEPDQKLPLEYCFYENTEEVLGAKLVFEPGLNLRKEKEELSTESGTTEGPEKTDPDSTSTSIIDSFIAFSSKLRDRLNG